MKGLELLKFYAKLNTLKEISEEYPGRTIENIIVQLESRLKELN